MMHTIHGNYSFNNRVCNHGFKEIHKNKTKQRTTFPCAKIIEPFPERLLRKGGLEIPEKEVTMRRCSFPEVFFSFLCLPFSLPVPLSLSPFCTKKEDDSDETRDFFSLFSAFATEVKCQHIDNFSSR